MLPKLTVDALCAEARIFADVESTYAEPALYGVTDGKAIGTYFEHKVRAYVATKYDFTSGSSGKGIDFPSIGVDVEVTSIKQPQSSCPFKSAEKIYGLGYSLLIFVYDKTDDPKTASGILKVLHTVFVAAAHTADYQMTRGLRDILDKNGNEDDLVAFILDRFLPVDEIGAHAIAAEVLKKKPQQGYLTISNALQWRLQYRRVIEAAGKVRGLNRIR